MARTFDGVDDQVAFGSESDIDDLPAYTAIACVRVAADVTDERQIFTKMNSSFTGTMYLAATGGGGNNNKIFTLVSGSTTWYAESAVSALVPNAWRWIAASWAGGAAAAKLYASNFGSPLVELSYTGTPAGGSGRFSDAAATLRIGARDSLDATFYTGDLCEVSLYNRVLSADELAAIGKGFSAAFFPNGRVRYCPVDGRHSPELSYSANAAGTLTGTTFVDHPPIMYPGKHVWLGKGSAAATFNAAWAATANVILGTGPR